MKKPTSCPKIDPSCKVKSTNKTCTITNNTCSITSTSPADHNTLRPITSILLKTPSNQTLKNTPAHDSSSTITSSTSHETFHAPNNSDYVGHGNKATIQLANLVNELELDAENSIEPNTSDSVTNLIVNESYIIRSNQPIPIPNANKYITSLKTNISSVNDKNNTNFKMPASNSNINNNLSGPSDSEPLKLISCPKKVVSASRIDNLYPAYKIENKYTAINNNESKPFGIHSIARTKSYQHNNSENMPNTSRSQLINSKPKPYRRGKSDSVYSSLNSPNNSNTFIKDDKETVDTPKEYETVKSNIYKGSRSRELNPTIEAAGEKLNKQIPAASVRKMYPYEVYMKNNSNDTNVNIDKTTSDSSKFQNTNLMNNIARLQSPSPPFNQLSPPISRVSSPINTPKSPNSEVSAEFSHVNHVPIGNDISSEFSVRNNNIIDANLVDSKFNDHNSQINGIKTTESFIRSKTPFERAKTKIEKKLDRALSPTYSDATNIKSDCQLLETDIPQYCNDAKESRTYADNMPEEKEKSSSVYKKITSKLGKSFNQTETESCKDNSQEEKFKLKRPSIFLKAKSMTRIVTPDSKDKEESTDKKTSRKLSNALNKFLGRQPDQDIKTVNEKCSGTSNLPKMADTNKSNVDISTMNKSSPLKIINVSQISGNKADEITTVGTKYESKALIKSSSCTKDAFDSSNTVDNARSPIHYIKADSKLCSNNVMSATEGNIQIDNDSSFTKYKPKVNSIEKVSTKELKIDVSNEEKGTPYPKKSISYDKCDSKSIPTHPTNDIDSQCITSLSGELMSEDDSESVMDRITRKSFYNRFQNKKEVKARAPPINKLDEDQQLEAAKARLLYGNCNDKLQRHASGLPTKSGITQSAVRKTSKETPINGTEKTSIPNSVTSYEHIPTEYRTRKHSDTIRNTRSRESSITPDFIDSQQRRPSYMSISDQYRKISDDLYRPKSRESSVIADDLGSRHIADRRSYAPVSDTSRRQSRESSLVSDGSKNNKNLFMSTNEPHRKQSELNRSTNSRESSVTQDRSDVMQRRSSYVPTEDRFRKYGNSYRSTVSREPSVNRDCLESPQNRSLYTPSDDRFRKQLNAMRSPGSRESSFIQDNSDSKQRINSFVSSVANDSQNTRNDVLNPPKSNPVLSTIDPNRYLPKVSADSSTNVPFRRPVNYRRANTTNYNEGLPSPTVHSPTNYVPKPTSPTAYSPTNYVPKPTSTQRSSLVSPKSTVNTYMSLPRPTPTYRRTSTAYIPSPTTELGSPSDFRSLLRPSNRRYSSTR